MKLAIMLGTAVLAGAAALFLGPDARWALAIGLLGACYASMIWDAMQ